VAGVEVILSEFTENKTDYKEKTIELGFISNPGESVTLRFHLKTSNSAYKARAKLISYTYSILEAQKEPETPEPEQGIDRECIISIECPSESAANTLVDTLKISGYIGDENIKIFKKLP
jgi:hypothetical protein